MKKTSFEEVKKAFENRGYELLETEYVNKNKKMNYKCPKHPEKTLSITFDSFKNQNSGCPYCGREKAAEKQRRSITDVKDEFKKRGYILLENEYVTSITPIRLECIKHPCEVLITTYASFKHQNAGCKYCGRERQIQQNLGEKSHFWKGGITELTTYLRESLTEWKLKSIAQFNYKCIITNENTGDLQIHHTKPFHIIRDEVFSELNMTIHPTIGHYSEDEIENIIIKLKEKHQEVLGVPIKKEIHMLFHQIYGKRTTMQDLMEFKSRYISGEYN